MSAKNVYHDAVVDALVADGWTITHDPLPLEFGGRKLRVDLGAERSPIAAEKAGEKIAVEVQSCLQPSAVADLHQALGQYSVYRLVLAGQQPDRPLYLGVPTEAYQGILSEPLGQAALNGLGVRVVVFDPDRREIVKWIG
ncbi:MAG: XisH family protein [Gemmataceae bacterium]|nr:XisH family protein [Gemmataceae bacterium]